MSIGLIVIGAGSSAALNDDLVTLFFQIFGYKGGFSNGKSVLKLMRQDKLPNNVDWSVQWKLRQ